MWDDVDDSEAGEYAALPEIKPTLEEIKAAAAVVVFIEHELGIDVKRLRVRVRERAVYIQGSVSSREERTLIERSLPKQPHVSSVELVIFVNDND